MGALYLATIFAIVALVVAGIGKICSWIILDAY
jgi:hypothetical protein